MRLNKTAIAAAAALALGATTASAAVFEFTITSVAPGQGVSGSGFITTASDPTSAVTSITGTIFDSAFSPGTFTIVSGLAGLSSYAAADNVFYLGIPANSFGGISFHTTCALALCPDYNIGGGGVTAPDDDVLNDSINDPGGYPNPNAPAPGAGSTEINFDVSEVPEPAAWVTMLIGSGLAGAAIRASRKRTLAAA
jgi:hypothetical protein